MATTADTARPTLPPTLYDATVQQCPYDHYKAMRDEAPVWQDPKTGMFIVTRYDDVRMVLTDSDRFSSDTRRIKRPAAYWERSRNLQDYYREKGWVPDRTLASRDDPEHAQMRAMFDQAFRAGKIKELDPLVQSLAYRLIDDFIADGKCEWVHQFAVPLPLYIIGRQMGADEADMWQIKVWTDAFFHKIGGMLDPAAEMEIVDKEIEGQHYFQKIFERLRANPDDSMISVLVNTVIEGWGRPLNDNELHAEMYADTFVGGSETTTNALSAGMKLLIENKNVWDRLKTDPDKYIRPFIEEVLRLESPVQGLIRVAARDTELHGVAIPEGAIVMVRYAAANRDERQFECPEKLDLDRQRPGSHLAFGSGVHHCLGAPLARRELYWGFRAVVDRFDDMWFAEGVTDFEVHPHLLLRSLKQLPITFRARA